MSRYPSIELANLCCTDTETEKVGNGEAAISKNIGNGNGNGNFKGFIMTSIYIHN